MSKLTNIQQNEQQHYIIAAKRSCHFRNGDNSEVRMHDIDDHQLPERKKSLIYFFYYSSNMLSLRIYRIY